MARLIQIRSLHLTAHYNQSSCGVLPEHLFFNAQHVRPQSRQTITIESRTGWWCLNETEL